MDTKLEWKKEFFKDSYKIYSDSVKIGVLKKLSWSQTQKGKLNGSEYLFKKMGFFTQSVEIIDASSKTAIGRITYNAWGTKATVKLDGETYHWKFNNLWNTKWIISRNGKPKIQYHGSTSKGKIKYDNLAEPLVLAGLFIAKHYWETIFTTAITVIIPIIIVNA